MTGLEKILKHIEDSALENAEKIIEEANKKAGEIIHAANVEGEKKRTEINSRSAQDVKAVLDRGESAALLQEKKIILEAKQQIMSDAIDGARKSLLDLPDQDYFETILKMVKKHALNQQGEIVFSKDDRKRLPGQFEKEIKNAISDKPDASLRISDMSRDIDGGFILIYGDIEENCSFEALFSAARENLQDKVSALLFNS